MSILLSLSLTEYICADTECFVREDRTNLTFVMKGEDPKTTKSGRKSAGKRNTVDDGTLLNLS